MDTPTKQDIERYYGSVEAYKEHLKLQRQKYDLDRERLKSMAPFQIFTLDVRQMSINNTRFLHTLTDMQAEMIAVFDKQIEEIDEKLNKVY